MAFFAGIGACHGEPAPVRPHAPEPSLSGEGGPPSPEPEIDAASLAEPSPSPPSPPAAAAPIALLEPRPPGAPPKPQRFPGEPVVAVEVGLAPKAGLTADEARRATTAIGIVRARTQICLAAALRSNPAMPGTTTMTVTVKSPGGAAPSTVVFGKAPRSELARQCLERVIGLAIGGDAKPATIGFKVRVDVTP